MRKSEALVDFYRTVKKDSRSKLFMGPDFNAGAGRMLGAAHLATPMIDLFNQVDRLLAELLRFPFQILLFGAGMAGQIRGHQVLGAVP